MAIEYWAGATITGLSTDAKPNAPDGYLFVETDTPAEFLRHDGVWEEAS
jgi:hypothetical protein